MSISYYFNKKKIDKKSTYNYYILKLLGADKKYLDELVVDFEF